MTRYEHVRYEEAEPPVGWEDLEVAGAAARPVRVLTIDRPGKRNAVDPATARELRDAVTRFRDDDEARVLVLTGAGEAFSSGADLVAWRDALEEGGAEDLTGGSGPLGFTRMLDVGKPTVAAVNGPCLAGGMEMASWCDIRIAEHQATFGFLERRWNVVLADGGTQRFPRIVGLGRAMDLILTGRAFDVKEAYEMGFVTEIVGREEGVRRAVEVAHHLAAAPQDALLADREALLKGVGRSLEEGLKVEAESVGIYEDPDVLERLRNRVDAFLEGER